jgi:putative membrane protein
VIDQLPTALTLCTLALYVLGERRAAVITGRRRERRPQLTFYAGLAVILVALESPIDSLAAKLFWAHMLQHLLLLVVAAPLIVIARPWMSIWRPLPLSLRRAIAHAAARWTAAQPLRTLLGALASPAGAWLAFNANLVAWHMPGAYDATLRHTWIHVLANGSFLWFGVLFWAQVVSASPARVRMPVPWRIGFVASTTVVNVGLSMYLAFAQHPLYAPYAALAHRPGGFSALADQQIGAGLMWTLGDFPFAIAIALLIQRWLADQETAPNTIASG